MNEDPMDEPSFSKTYKRADGGDIDGCAWVTDLAYFDEEWGPVLLIEERWEQTGSTLFWQLPEPIACDCEVDPECDEDATRWAFKDEMPVPACDLHCDGFVERSDGERAMLAVRKVREQREDNP